MKASKKQGTNPEKTENVPHKINPGKPDNDPDQTPEREVKNPPVAPEKQQDQPNKIGFTSLPDNFLQF